MSTGTLTTITVTGTFTDGQGNPLSGTVAFTPTATVIGSTAHVVIPMEAVSATVSAATGSFSALLVCTDNAGLTPNGWGYTVDVSVTGLSETFSVLIPSTYGTTVDISALMSTGTLPLVVNTVATLSTGGTIATSGLGLSLVTTTAAVTGAIMQAGTTVGQQVAVVNESANSVTMAATGSNVSTGSACVIAANSAVNFYWANSLWYPV